MKTKEELQELKEEIETLNKKHDELTDEELEQVSGGIEDIGTHRDSHSPAYPRFRKSPRY